MSVISGNAPPVIYRERAFIFCFFSTGGYAIILLAVTLSVSAAGVGFEIFNKVEGCCGTYPSACTYAREIEAFRKKVDNKTEVVDKLFLKGKIYFMRMEFLETTWGRIVDKHCLYDANLPTKIHNRCCILLCFTSQSISDQWHFT
jgi:hypothetical protein